MKPFARTLTMILFMSCFGPARSHAGWIEYGVPLTRQWSAAGAGAIAPDGSSGAIIAYQVCHDGVTRIVMQRVDSLGVVVWGQEGIEVCTASGDQGNPAIISDGSGGAIVAWHGLRSGNYDIYAQRVNASGAVQWASDGVALCAATANQTYPAITPDGAGGAIVMWSDYRNGHYDTYAQRVSVSGDIQWTVNGVFLGTAAVSQQAPQITADGAGGAIVTWKDSRSGINGIYAQRVNASGAVEWTTDGVALCTATENRYYPKITSDNAGGAIVAWFDYRSQSTYDVYAQRVDASGAVRWTADGVPLGTGAGDQQNPQLVSDGAGGAVVAWRDSRSGSMQYHIYAQRVNASGAVQWTVNGVALCTAAETALEGAGSPAIASDGAGGAIVTWEDLRGANYDIYAQRVNASGAVQWIVNGVALCAAAGDQFVHAIVSDDAGGAIVVGARSSDIFVQRVNGSGSVRWTADGVVVSASTGDQYYPAIVSDGAGGAVVTWQDSDSGDDGIHAQKINASGAVQWNANGAVLCAAAGYQGNPVIASDGAGGAIVAWVDSRSGGYDIYAQRVDASGAARWAADGVLLGTAPFQEYPMIVPDGAGGAIVAWKDSCGGNPRYDIYAQRVNASGAIRWAVDGVALCTVAISGGSPSIASDGAGGAIVAWDDKRSENYDIYAQRVDSSGVVRWTENGVGVCVEAAGQISPAITADGAGGALVAWRDWRSGISADIYAQRIDSSGAARWTADGVVLCAAMFDRQNIQISPDGAGGAIVVWEDYRDFGWDIYAQRVDSSGSVRWTADGVALCAVGGDQMNARISPDGAGGAVISWMDHRGGSWRVYTQRVDAAGASLWAWAGVAPCAAGWPQRYHAIASDGGGGAIVAWEDYRCGASICAQRVRGSGEIVSTLLQNHAAARAARGIRIEWSLSEMDDGARFSILRASAPEWRFVELESAAIEKNGLSFTCTDESCLPGSTYKYRVECEVEGAAQRVLFETDAIAMPALPVTLYQNHPNPFNPQTVIRFYLPEAQEILLDVYNVAGERVARLAEGKKEKGYHDVTWDGRNGSGAVCSSGVYFSRLKAGKFTDARKMILLR
jgi:hypothetical protein